MSPKLPWKCPHCGAPKRYPMALCGQCMRFSNQSVPNDDRGKMARELLAAELDADGDAKGAYYVRDSQGYTIRSVPAMRAITAAYNKGRADMREEASKAVDAEREGRERQHASAIKAKRYKDARDFETMMIAHVQSRAAIRAIAVGEG